MTFQTIAIVIMAMQIGFYLARNGQPKEGTHSVFASAISNAIWFAILYFGGFFE